MGIDLRPLQRLLLGVSEASKDEDDDLEEADRPAGTSRAPDQRRRRWSRNRSFKPMDTGKNIRYR
jgi:hypothetical protein